MENTHALESDLYTLYQSHFERFKTRALNPLKGILCGANLSYMYLHEQELDAKHHSFLEQSPFRFSLWTVLDNTKISAVEVFEKNQRWKDMLLRDLRELAITMNTEPGAFNPIFRARPTIIRKKTRNAMAQEALKILPRLNRFELIRWLLQRSASECVQLNAARMQRDVVAIRNWTKERIVNLLYGFVNPKIDPARPFQNDMQIFTTYMRRTSDDDEVSSVDTGSEDDEAPFFNTDSE